MLEQEDKVLMAQVADDELCKLVRVLHKSEEDRTKSERGAVKKFELRGQLLCRIRGNKKLFVMLKTMRKSIVVEAHDLSGHLSYNN